MQGEHVSAAEEKGGARRTSARVSTIARLRPTARFELISIGLSRTPPLATFTPSSRLETHACLLALSAFLRDPFALIDCARCPIVSGFVSFRELRACAEVSGSSSSSDEDCSAAAARLSFFFALRREANGMAEISE